MAALFANGRVIDGILVFIVVEILLMILIRKKARQGVAPLDLLSSLAAGIALLFALRAALLGSSWPVIAAFLLLSLCAHVVDLMRRWTTA
jgi:multisubunit Na+/H+ antiporter MnhB subunit